jgi:FkbH-like protein
LNTVIVAITPNSELVRALSVNREKISRSLLESVRLYPRWQAAVEKEDINTFVKRELTVFVDYLIKAFKEGNKDYLLLYAGEKLKQRYDKNIDQELLAEIFSKELALSRKSFSDNLAGEVSQSALSMLDEALGSIEQTLILQTRKTLKILWVADCMYLDIQAFLAPKVAEMQVSLDITLVTTKNPVARRQELQKLAAETKFDIVFYSPISYEFNLDFAQFQNAKAVLTNSFNKQLAIINTLHEIELTLNCIVENVECDVFVHNTANLIRSENTLKSRAKFYATSLARHRARDAINARIMDLIERLNQTAFGSVCLIDEMQVVESEGEWEASQYFHMLALQHPAKLGASLANVYADIIFVESYLKSIKLIVTDLDNTLWDGIIGEGDVRHYHHRQRTLRVLKEKGLLLAVNSKNDVKNVHWHGAQLNESDFVSTQINWDPKPSNMARIQKELNLKFGNFLFLDDRAEERELVQIAFPDVLCLDAELQETWGRLSTWARIAKNTGQLDRTQMYAERAARENFSSVGIDPDALMAQLGLVVRVRETQKDELPRVTELINRTNQFNCCNSRVSFRDVQNWGQCNNWKIYIADVKDRFGEMGIVSVLVAHSNKQIIDIEAFVLSCRVFGYGIEGAVLKRLADDHKEFAVRGKIVKTPINQPCHNVFNDHGFTAQEADTWLLQPHSAIALKPWLNVSAYK